MNKVIYSLLLSISSLPILAHSESPYFSLKDGDGFKRFSVSAGWLHAAPQGSANPLNNSTAVAEGTKSKVGNVSKSAVLDAAVKSSNPGIYGAISLFPGDTIPSSLSGTATINGLSSWQAPNTGLEADSVDTLGILANYYFTDHWSLEIKAGIPPTVNIKGKGMAYAPLRGSNSPVLDFGALNIPLSSIDLKKDIPITDLSQGSKAASTRAWLPAAEIHYQFGQSGINKFRPYIGAGVIYGYFDKVKLNPGIEADLVSAGHRIQNILDNKAGAALDNKLSSADPRVKVKAGDSFAPIVTLGATYDFSPNWFAVGSVSYAKMSSTTKITVTDNNTGNELIRSSTKIDIDPLITYLGVGYRF